MIFPFVKLSTRLQKLHIGLMHLITEVWCKAGSWDEKNLEPGFLALVRKIDARKHHDKRLLVRFARLHDLFSNLSPADRVRIASDARQMDDLLLLCKDKGLEPLRFASLRAMSAPLAGELKDLFYELFDETLRSGSAEKELGTLRAHYDALVSAQASKLCPFCGLIPILTKDSKPRDAFDHFLPRSIYPLQAVNFDQLVPMCKRCNEQFKRDADPLYDGDETRRRAFYPFDCAPCAFSISITLPTKYLREVQAEEIGLSINGDEFFEEVGTWKEVFDLENRYREFSAIPDGCRESVVEILNYTDSLGLPYKHVFTAAIENGLKRPARDQNFLRVPYLEACDRIGVFDEPENREL